MKCSIVILVVLLLLSGCSKKDNEGPILNVVTGTEAGEYSYVLPFDSTQIRYAHSSVDVNEIGIGMERYAKKYFSAKEFMIMEGQIISEYESLYRPLVMRRESEDNPQGLNPSTGSLFDTGTSYGKVALDNNIITDLFEINFIDKKTEKLAGIAITLVGREENATTINGVSETFSISSDKLYDYMSNAGRKLESYLRKLQGVGDVPILVLLYSGSSSDATLPGGFTAEGLFKGRTGQFNKVNEKWVLFPTQEALGMDATTYSQFDNFQKSLKEFVPENVGAIGKGLYVNQKLNKLIVNVNLQSKTYSEIHALTQFCVQLSQNFTESDMNLIIEIKLGSETMSVIKRENGSNQVNVIYLD